MTEETKEPEASTALGGQNERLVILPVCPFCKKRMEVEGVLTGNGCGEYDTEYFWVCECEDLKPHIVG